MYNNDTGYGDLKWYHVIALYILIPIGLALICAWVIGMYVRDFFHDLFDKYFSL
jgi:hypothetical protein